MIASIKTWKRLYRSAKVPFSYRSYSKDNKNPFKRTWSILSKEVPVFLGLNKKEVVYPEHADVVIIGGGFIGTAVAYWLKVKAGEGLAVVVIENDPLVSCLKIALYFFPSMQNIFKLLFFIYSLNQYRKTYHLEQ